MHNLHISRVGSDDRIIPSTDVALSAHNILIHEFDPYSYTVRHNDTEKLLADGGFTSRHFIKPKDFILKFTAFGTPYDLHRTVPSYFPFTSEMVLHWTDSPEPPTSNNQNYLYTKVIGMDAKVLSHTLAGENSSREFTVRFKSVDPFIYTSQRTGTGGFNLFVPGTITWNSRSDIDHIVRSMRFYIDWDSNIGDAMPDSSTDVPMKFDVTNTTNGSSVSVELPGDDDRRIGFYTPWELYGEEYPVSWATRVGPEDINDVIERRVEFWDGNFLWFSPGTNTIEFVAEAVGSGTATHVGIGLSGSPRLI